MQQISEAIDTALVHLWVEMEAREELHDLLSGRHDASFQDALATLKSAGVAWAVEGSVLKQGRGAALHVCFFFSCGGCSGYRSACISISISVQAAGKNER